MAVQLQLKIVIWTAGVKGATINGINPDAITKGNRILVDGFNQIIGEENIYAIGDIALMQADSAYPNGASRSSTGGDATG
jgi:NADH dehydrogenase